MAEESQAGEGPPKKPASESFVSRGRILIWDVAANKPSAEPPDLGPTTLVRRVVFSPNGKVLAVASDFGPIVLWDIEARKTIRTIVGTEQTVIINGQPYTIGSAPVPVGQAPVPVGSAPVTAGSAPVTVGQAPVLTLDLLPVLAFSPDGKTLAAAGLTWNDMRLWDVASGQAVSDPLVGHSAPITQVAFSPDGAFLVSADMGGRVLVWDVQPRWGRLWAETDTSFSGGLAYSPDGTRLAWGGGGSFVLWDVKSRKPLGDPARSGESLIGAVAFNPQGTILASGGVDPQVNLWDARTRERLGSPLALESPAIIWSLAFSPDGNILAAGVRRVVDKSTIFLWDLKRPKEAPITLTGEAGAVRELAFSPDGSILAASEASSSNPVANAALSIWNLDERGRWVPRQRLDSTTLSLAFHPDGKTLATGERGDVVLRDVAGLSAGGPRLPCSSDFVFAVAFSPDGGRLAAGSQDGLILWDVSERRVLGQIRAGKIIGVAFSPDGETLATGNLDLGVKLWDARPESWQARAASIANRNLSESEWEQYIGRDQPYRKLIPELPVPDGPPSPPLADAPP